jgi:hypothetical protein
MAVGIIDGDAEGCQTTRSSFDTLRMSGRELGEWRRSVIGVTIDENEAS